VYSNSQLQFFKLINQLMQINKQIKTQPHRSVTTNYPLSFQSTSHHPKYFSTVNFNTALLYMSQFHKLQNNVFWGWNTSTEMSVTQVHRY